MIYSDEFCYYGLTNPQKRILYTENIFSCPEIWNIGGAIKIYGKVDLQKLEKAINLLIEKNDVFRFRFIQKDNEVQQYVAGYQGKVIDGFNFNTYEDFVSWTSNDMNKKFKLFDDELYYFAICSVRNDCTYVYLRMHHIITDGWSYSLIAKQLCEIYNKLNSEGIEEYTEESVEYSYIDFIKNEQEYFKSVRYEKDREYWLSKFESLPEDLFNERSSDVNGRRKVFNLDLEKSLKIKQFIKEYKLSLNTFFIAVYSIFINKIYQKEDIVLGTPVLNRASKKERNMIGMFTSTMPFRYNLKPDIIIEDLVNEVNKELMKSFFHQKYPYNFLVKDLELSRQGYDSLFETCINCYNTDFRYCINDIPIESIEFYSGKQAYSLQLIIKDWREGGELTLALDYKIDRYSDEDIEQIYSYLNKIIDQMITKPQEQIKNIDLLTSEEKTKLMYELNSVKADYPKDKTIYELFEEQADKTPRNVALSFEDKELTYKELNTKANQLARKLRERGIKRESKVGIMTRHSLETVISILAVMKAGAVYVPMDPAYPAERINYMIEDSEIKLILTNIEIDTGSFSKLNFNGEVLRIDDFRLFSGENDNLEKFNSPEDLVYIIYTSGSTGRPKGVMIKHMGLVNYIWWAKKMYITDSKDTFALYSSLSFDLTVTSIFTPLIAGNKLNIYYDDGTEFILYKILRDNQTSIIKLTPAHLQLLRDMDNSKSAVKTFIVGGENLKCNLASEIYKSFNGKIRIFNEYGPTETVVGCMIYEYNYEKDKEGSVPIGGPADNVQVYILDKYLNILPSKVVGELYISGDGVAKGYLNNKELTEKVFINNPFIPGKIMYKTGDTAKYGENEVIEYIGRVDKQIKIRGHRIEIEEIEKQLLKLKGIKAAVVIVYDDPSGEKKLCAYVISSEVLKAKETRKQLSEFLPNYMIPAYVEQIDKIPLTANGKIDTKLLPLPDFNAKSKGFIQASNDREEVLINAAKQILNVENISINDNFYELGGDSIKAIQISSQLNNVGLKITVKDILSKDSFEEIASCIESSKRDVQQGICEGEIEKTPIIEWFFEQKFSQCNYWNQSVLLRISSNLSIEMLQKAISEIIRHHDGLRINYNKELNVLYYNNEYLKINQNIEFYDLSALDKEKQKIRLMEIGEELKGSFDIENKILFKAAAFDLGAGERRLLLIAHHLVVDGVSWRIILEDLNILLQQQINGQEIRLPLKTHSFQEWAEELTHFIGKIPEAEKDYWRKIELSHEQIEGDFNLEKDTYDTVESIEVLKEVLSKENTDALLTKANEAYGTEGSELLIIALALAAFKQFQRETITFELEGHGRENISEEVDVARTVGWFTSMYSAQLRAGNTDLGSNIKELKEQLRGIPRKGFGYGILKYAAKTLSYTDEQHIRFNYLGDFQNSLQGELFELAKEDSGCDFGKENKITCLLEVIAMVIEGRLSISISYSKNRFERDTMVNLLNEYVKQINSLINHCCNIKGREFTPSDFDGLEISQDDLESLFT